MKIIDRYITVHLLMTSAVALLVLLTLFAVLSLIDQLGDVGRGNYDIIKAILYVLLTLPRIAFELMPIAAVIGGMTTLGILSHNSELVIIRTSGASRYRLVYSMIKGGMFIVLAAIITGELIAPYCEQTAQHMRSIAQTEQITLKTRNGFWSRDGLSFVNIRRILPGNQVEEIYIYEFDVDDRLRASTYAKSGKYVEDQWLLEDIEQSIIEEGRITRKELKLAAWESLLSPDVISLVTIKPEYLALWGLFEYIDYLKKNSQNSGRYEQALWSKLISPFTILAMIVLAVPMVRSHSREISIGQRVFTGVLAGVAFHIINQISGQAGIVYSINAAISATLPTLLVAGVTAWMLRRDI
jgi:Predicted permeases